MRQIQRQNGFTVVMGLLIVAAIIAVVVMGVFVVNRNTPSSTNTKASTTDAQSTQTKIKHIGVDIAAYDPLTGRVGDFKFTKESMALDMLFFEYGFNVPANSAGPARKNPQPTFILPLGTKVHALVDGVVTNIPTLYSGDYSIMMAGKEGDLIFELEHVKNVTVKVGDTVRAGDEIAEVSDYDAKNYAGMGLVEIGILKSGNPPSHLCPFEYLDDSIKEETFKKLTELQKSWEEYRDNPDTYDESQAAIPGCLTLEQIEG